MFSVSRKQAQKGLPEEVEEAKTGTKSEPLLQQYKLAGLNPGRFSPEPNLLTVKKALKPT